MTATLDAVVGRIPRPRDDVAREVRHLLDAKTKPPGSLGRLEDLACRLAAIRGEVPDGSLLPAIVVAAADHGVAAEGVSPYPQVVTGQMLANFASGGAAVSVLAREAGARLVVVDAGVLDPPPVGDVRNAVEDGVRGSGNIAHGAAMSRAVAVALIERGIALAEELAAAGVGIVGLGDMGIANTTAASAVCAALLPADPSDVCGPGTGLDGPGVERKVGVVCAALRANDLGERGGAPDPLDVLAGVGGLEIAFLTGVVLGAASRRVPVLLDGFVTGAAALVAAGLAPAVTGSLIAATRSPEPGHPLVLERLDLVPLLDLGLRLGEGSGAALALPLVRAAVAILTDMATFDAAGVSRA
ncbi:MAG: nicotinate-nucleotide--dimethylbenzimidazole phosphoribosyltransferase [Actinomycetota bacterium]